MLILSECPDTQSNMRAVVASSPEVFAPTKGGYIRHWLMVVGLGVLLYGVHVGNIAGALPYLEATSGPNPGQLSLTP